MKSLKPKKDLKPRGFYLLPGILAVAFIAYVAVRYGVNSHTAPEWVTSGFNIAAGVLMVYAVAIVIEEVVRVGVEKAIKNLSEYEL